MGDSVVINFSYKYNDSDIALTITHTRTDRVIVSHSKDKSFVQISNCENFTFTGGVSLIDAG